MKKLLSLVLAMMLMLGDHLWGTYLLHYEWLTCLGRICFPLFAFLSVEGFFHTHDRINYMKRLLIFALISEIPFDLMMQSTPFFPFHQNVIWVFLIGNGMMYLTEKIKEKYSKPVWIALSALILLAAFLLATITFSDFYGYGILTMAGFYWFHGYKWWQRIGQAAVLFYVNYELMGGYCMLFHIGSTVLEVPQQAFALLALPLIWLYRGNQGYHSRKWQMFCYWFYPAHALALYLIKLVLF